MSQYVPGAIDYIPVIQPYKPNLNLFQQVLQTKQSQYNAGYDQISSLYGTMLESPMLKTENIEARNKFFTDISGQIQRISGLDLSRRENIEAASKVFQPLIDNDYIMKDMAFTKKYQQALDRHEYFKNCLDEKKCGGKSWEEGLAYVQYKAEDFVNASLDESLNMANPEYIPYTNAVEKAVKFAKDMDFKKQTLTQNGRYNIITENGAAAVPGLTDFFLANFAKDGNIRRTYDVLSYLKRKDYAKGNADQFNGSEEEAEMHYLNSIGEYIDAESQEAQEAALAKLDLAKNKQKAIEDIASSQGLDPNDPKDKALINEHQQSITDQLILQGTADFNQETSELVNPDVMNTADLNTKRARIDAAMANNLFTTDMFQAAQSYAELTEKVIKFDADPYALASHEASLSLRNSLAVENARFAHDMELARLKGEITNPEDSNEQQRQDGPDPGSTAKIENLLETEGKAEVALGLSVGAELDNASKNIVGTLQTVLGSENGTRLDNNLIVSDELKKEIRSELDYIYNGGSTQDRSGEKINIMSLISGRTPGAENTGQPADTVPLVNPLDKKESSGFWDKVGDFFFGAEDEDLFGRKLYSNESKVLEANFRKEQELAAKTESYGFFNADGSLMEMNSNPALYDTKSRLHYDKVIDRLAEVMGREGSMLNRFASSDPEIINSLGRLTSAKTNLQIESDRIGQNTALIINSNPKNMGVDISGVSNVNAQNMLDKIAVGSENNKHFVPREQWVNDYVASYQSNGRGVSKPGYPGFGGGDEETNKALARSEAEDLYDAYFDNFRSEYNRGSDAIQPYKGFKPPKAFKIKDGGAFLQADTYTIEGISSQFPSAAGATGAKYTWNDLSKALNDPMYNNKVAVLINDDPGSYTKGGEKDIADLFDKDLDERVNQRGVDVLGMIYGRLSSGADKKDKALKFSTTVHPIAGNDEDLVAVEFTINPEFAYNEQGSSNTLGILGIGTEGSKVGPIRSVSVIMPKAAVSPDNPFFSGLNETVDDKYVNTYGNLSITGYDSGRAYLRTYGDHGFNYQIYTKDENGQEVATGGYISRNDITAGQFATLVRNDFAQEQNRINLAKVVNRNSNPNRIFDLSTLNMNP